MSPTALLGYLNGFVEHQNKKVILIANEDELRRKNDTAYSATKEKLVGRTITIKPDADGALDAFLSEIKKSEFRDDVKEFIVSFRDGIARVFTEAEVHSLRLLRNAISEFAIFAQNIPAEIFNQTERMRSVFATYLALHLAYHHGQGFTIKDLEQETNWARYLWKNSDKTAEEPPETEIEKCRTRHANNRHVDLEQNVISPELALALIGKGFASTEQISEALGSKDIPWRNLWYWRRRDEKDVEENLMSVLASLEHYEYVEPTEILHISGTVLELGRRKIHWRGEDDAFGFMKNYIDGVAIQNLLPRIFPKGRFKTSDGDEGFGYPKNDSKFDELVAYIVHALDRAFWNNRAEDGKKLLTTWHTDAGEFRELLLGRSHRSNCLYDGVPIFQFLDPQETAKTVFRMKINQMQTGLDAFEYYIDGLSTRLCSADQIAKERQWMQSFHDVAQEIAKNSKPIRAAQIQNSLQWHFGFLNRADGIQENEKGAP